jgi:tRNA nucleotidyltransferase (CCA-adding enzyme)
MIKIYKVGGCVRDKLLGLPVSDDNYIVVGSSPNDWLYREMYYYVGGQIRFSNETVPY